MLPKYKIFSWACILILGISFLTGLNVATRRLQFEAANQNVDLVVSLNEVNKLAHLGGIDRATLLSQLSQQTGISSIAVEEETIQHFIDQGSITFLKGSEIMNMLRVGKVYRTILTHLAKRTRVKKDRIYLVIDENKLYERIKDFLKVSLATGSVQERGWNILEVTTDEETLLNTGVGISKKVATELKGYGLSVIPRLKNNPRLNDALIKLKLQSISQLDNMNTVIFEGDTILGYPSKLPLLADLLREQNLQFGLIEFSNQKGTGALATRIPNSVIKVHSIGEGKMATISSKRALTRYIRSAKERGARILFLHPFFDHIGETNISDYNLAYFESIRKHLQDLRFNVTPVSGLPVKGYTPLQTWEWVILSIGLWTWILLLINHFIKLKPRFTITLTAIFGIMAGLFYITGQDASWNNLMALTAATLFPIFAIIHFFPSEERSLKLKRRLLSCGIYMLQVFGVALIGALFVIGFTSDLSYLLSIQQFFGVKISFLLPLLAVGAYFYLRPHRIKSFHYVFKRLFHAPITTGSLTAVLLCTLIIAIYILRSGNYLSIPWLETSMRQSLESWFFIRPRTKEFLIGYPFLMIAFLYVDLKISRRWLWFFSILGCVALTSLINSFCHIHTPITVSLFRSILGLLLGILVGGIYIGIFKTSELIFKRLCD